MCIVNHNESDYGFNFDKLIISTTLQWFSLHSWIKNLFYVLPIHWVTLILMNIALKGEKRSVSLGSMRDL